MSRRSFLRQVGAVGVSALFLTVGCSENTTRSASPPDPVSVVNERDLIHDGVLYMPEDASLVAAQPETISISGETGEVTTSNSLPHFNKIQLPDGSMIDLTAPIIDPNANGVVLSESDVQRIQQRLNVSASPQTIRTYMLTNNQWVTALCLDMTDQAWVFYFPHAQGNRTLKFRNGMFWNEQVLMLPHWKNAQSSWNQWTSWWVAPWYQYKNLYSGSSDIAYLFVVVQGNSKGASVIMTVY